MHSNEKTGGENFEKRPLLMKSFFYQLHVNSNLGNPNGCGNKELSETFFRERARIMPDNRSSRHYPWGGIRVCPGRNLSGEAATSIGDCFTSGNCSRRSGNMLQVTPCISAQMHASARSHALEGFG